MQMRVWWMIAAALCAVAAHGDGPVTANWLPTTAGTYTLTDGANWDTGVAPTNVIDIANFAPGAIDGLGRGTEGLGTAAAESLRQFKALAAAFAGSRCVGCS